MTLANNGNITVKIHSASDCLRILPIGSSPDPPPIMYPVRRWPSVCGTGTYQVSTKEVGTHAVGATSSRALKTSTTNSPRIISEYNKLVSSLWSRRSIPIQYRVFAINNIRRSFGSSEENETPRHRYLGRKPWSFEKAGSFSPGGRRLETELMLTHVPLGLVVTLASKIKLLRLNKDQVRFAWYTFPLKAHGREVNDVSI
ncbi:hypothetical protein PCH_Pc16g05980 [Penicillium rubens Wisconsin 54-1255]|uniref:Uncharacterized protein n=1 Tax=Penicillium rubens (strain ATCC 28089 / DSM 1075 / NRRL 1951 / Wisconsin 54-1255) TaxID=500485 RepID=B6H8N2_PENRW|nr:hypothetical protein PCH_Pc16g05980 [Penicillium rubens Wisconsin 54-1255]